MMAFALVYRVTDQTQHTEKQTTLIMTGQHQTRFAAKLPTLIIGTVEPVPVYKNRPALIQSKVEQM